MQRNLKSYISYNELKEYLNVQKLDIKLNAVTSNKVISIPIFKDGVEVAREDKTVKEVFPYSLSFYNADDQQLAACLLNDKISEQLLVGNDLNVLTNATFKVVNINGLGIHNQPIIQLSITDLPLMTGLV